MGVTEIAKTINLGKSTVHRILVSLVQARLVRMDPTSRQYSLGFGLLQLSAGLLSGSEVSMTALPYLRELRQVTGETVSLNVRDHDHRVVVERLDTSHEIRYVAEIGRPLPFHIGAGGKVILAFLHESEVRRLLDAADLSTKQRQRIVKELAEIRAAGTAYTLGERLSGAGSISAPVFSHDGEVIASVNVLCLESRLKAETVRDFRRYVKATAMRISQEIGWQPSGPRQKRMNELQSGERGSRRANIR